MSETSNSAGTNRPVVIAILLLVASVAGFLASRALMPPPAPEHAMTLPEPRPLPDFELLRENGQAFSSGDFAGSWSLLFFGFTHCPDICPATLQVLAAARDKLAAADQPLPDIVLVSVDPERDTPEILSRYVTHFGEGVIGLTGELPQLTTLTSALGIYFSKEDATENGYNVAHSAHVIAINDRGEFAAVFSAPHSVDGFVNDLPLLMADR